MKCVKLDCNFQLPVATSAAVDCELENMYRILDCPGICQIFLMGDGGNGMAISIFYFSTTHEF